MDRLEFDKEEMLALWKRAHGMEPLRHDCELVRTDGPDADSILEHDMRCWYLRCLMEDDPATLPLTDLASQVTLTASPSGAAGVTLPEECVRVVHVMMEGWEREAEVVDDPLDRRAIAMTNPFGRAGAARPVAVVEGSSLRLYSPVSASAQITRLEVVMLPQSDELYILTSAMMAKLQFEL